MIKIRVVFSTSIIYLLLMLQAGMGQNGFRWTRKIGGGDVDALTAMAKMQNENTVACGYFASSYCSLGQFNLENQPGSYYRNFWLALYDSNGNVLWAKSGGGEGDDEATCIAVDAQNNVYVAGSFQSYTFSVGNETLYKDLYQDYFDSDAFVCSFDGSGALRWIKGIYDNGSLELSGLTLDTQGNLLMSGRFSGDSIYTDQLSAQNSSPSLDEGFVLKMDAQGTAVWLRSIGGDGDDNAAKITSHVNGNITLAGTSSSSLLSNGLSTISNPNLNTLVFLSSLDQNGNAGWLNATNMPGYSELSALGHDATDNLIVLGEFSGDSLLFAADTLLSDLVSVNSMILRFTSDGTPLSGFYIGGANDDFANALSIDASGNIHITGSFKSASIRLGNFTLNRSGNDQSMGDAFYACFAPNGQCTNAFKIGSSKHESGSAVIAKNPSEFWIGGQFSSSSLFIGEWLLEAGGGENSDGFIAHFAPLNATMNPSENSFLFDIFPNPSAGDVQIQIPGSSAPWQLDLLDAHGDLLDIVSVNQAASEQDAPFHLTLPHSGVFILRLQCKDGFYYRKLVSVK